MSLASLIATGIVVTNAAALGVPALERRYVARDIVCLPGADDTDPDHRLLNKTCAADVQGPTRLARMQSFAADLTQRDGSVFKQPLRVVDGAAHNEAKVFGSPCGRAALFGDTDCPDKEETK